MPNIENISVRTNTLRPNGILVGNITNNNGVLSGFSTNSYFEIPNGRQADATYVVKFTTPSTASGKAEGILHMENYECVEMPASGVVQTYNWETSSAVSLIASPVANTTYWIKSVHSGNTRTYSVSTDGTSYTQVASFSDTGLNINFDSPSVLGNASKVNLLGRNFTGTIDLNGCYIEVGGEVVWRGMDYNNIQRIGGDEFDGQWVESAATLLNGVTVASGGNATASLSNYLPNDGYDYEVQFSFWGDSGTSSGNGYESLVYSGANNNFSVRCSRTTTRASSTQRGCCTGVIPVLANDKSLRVAISSGWTGSNVISLHVNRYRRIGKNGLHNNYVSNIVTDDRYYIDGNFLHGEWQPLNAQVFNASLANNTASAINLSNIIPDDGYSYWVMFSVTARTGTTSGNTVTARMGLSSTPNQNAGVCVQKTAANSNMTSAGNIILPVRARTVYIANTGGQTSGTITVKARGYRRMGTNG